MSKTGLLPLLFLSMVFLASGENKLKSYLEGERNKKATAALIETEAFATEKTPYANVFSSYERIRKALANDQLPMVEKLAAKLSIEGDVLLKNKKEKNGALIRKIKKTSGTLAKVKEEVSVRQAFGSVSEAVVALYKISGTSSLDFYHCPMAKGYGYWLQTKNEEINNPYMGTKMSRCGTKEELK